MQSGPDNSALPGTPQYLTGLLSRSREAHPDIPLDSAILQSLLTCLIAQPRSVGHVKLARNPGSHCGLHLILRTKEEDVGMVANVVMLTMQYVLGITPHKQKIPAKLLQPSGSRSRPQSKQAPCSSGRPQRPGPFLRSLFFHRSPASSHRSTNSASRTRVSGGEGTPRSGPSTLASAAKSPRGKSHGLMSQRSASPPSVNTDGEEEDHFFDASSLASSRRPLLATRTPGSTVRSTASKSRLGPRRQRADPLPLSSLFSPLGAQDVAEADESTPTNVSVNKRNSGSELITGTSGPPLALSRAVIVSGLEHASTPSQRALMRVLSEQRVVFDGEDDEEISSSGEDANANMEHGTWNLPDGFLMVYVCKWDPHERPAILGGLLDQFSMSTDISLSPSVRQSYTAYKATHTPTPRGTPIPSPSALPHTYLASSTPVNPSPARRPAPLPVQNPQIPPVIQPSELSYLRTLARPYPVAAPIYYPSVHATHEYPSVDLDPGPEPTPYAALHPSLERYLLDLFAATRHHPALDGTLLTLRAHTDAEAFARAFRVLNGNSIGAALIEHEARIGNQREVHFQIHDHDHDRDAAASWQTASGAWRSAESVVKRGKGSEELSIGGVRLRVEAEEMEPPPAAGIYDTLLQVVPELSPADAQMAAVKRSWPEVWDVSEEDVARIFPRVVSHRLRARDGPDDEVLGSIMFPAVPPIAGTGKAEAGDGVKIGWERKSVKDILVWILSDV